MTSVTLLPQSRPLTREDLAAMPDDGHRYELVDGALIVTPAPSDPHQAAVVNLVALLRAACTPDLRVRVAPYDVTLGEDTVVQPDVLLARKSDLAHQGLAAAPVLAIEVLSPSTRLIDLELKRARYEQAGVTHYWIVDPDAPRILALALREGRYVEVARASSADAFTVEAPVAVSFVPADLID